MRRVDAAIGFWLLAAAAYASEVRPPRALVDGVTVELVASEPDIVTPVGLAFDRSGRLLVVESHTHQRQENYDGPQGDRIRTLADSDGDGKLDKWGVFAEGYTHALNLAVHPGSGDVYLVCRNEVRRLRDTDDDGVADEDEVIVRCETAQQYPHNGLGGIAINGERLFLGMGENFDSPFTLVGSDDSQIEGRGGEGIVFTCGTRGDRLVRFAKGFWNPFGLCHEQHNLFAVDNDPHASPPCRLLNVLPGGDFGHRREYSSSGLHPLQAWNGELPGTLGMMASTGEAPCAVLMHEGWLWVSSWGDHRIERYRLNADGVVLRAEREIVVQGNADFRPTGMVVRGDAIYVADWVLRSYPVHGSGRLWRVLVSGSGASDKSLSSVFKRTLTPDRSLEEASSPHAKRLQRCTWALRMGFVASTGRGHSQTDDAFAQPRLHGLPVLRLQAHRWVEEVGQYPHAGKRDLILRDALADPDPDVRLYAVRWIADEHLTEFKNDVAKLLEGPIPSSKNVPSERYYLAVLAAVDWLSGPREQRASNFADGLLARELRNPRRSDELKAIALRTISPDHKQLTPDAMRAFLASDHEPLRAEAVRTLAIQSNPQQLELLGEVVTDGGLSPGLRADAVAGLAGDVMNRRSELETLAESSEPVIRAEARRVLRLAKLWPTENETKPPAEDTDAWIALLNQQSGDADSGRRLFYSAVGARCGVCHQHSGRGGEIGPELTLTAQKLSRRRLVESILQPSAEIAPQYQAWTLLTDEGRVRSGLRLAQAGDNGIERYADSSGETFTLASDQIDERTPSDASIMPKGLEQTVSVQDLRDLLAFLSDD